MGEAMLFFERLYAAITALSLMPPSTAATAGGICNVADGRSGIGEDAPAQMAHAFKTCRLMTRLQCAAILICRAH
jgi:hypothetical protein